MKTFSRASFQPKLHQPITVSKIMLKNLSLQTRLIAGFLAIGVIVFIVGIIGWNGTNTLSGHLNSLINGSLPSIQGLWQIKGGARTVNGSEKTLIANTLTSDQRQAELTNIENSFKDIKTGFKMYGDISRGQDEEALYQKLLTEWDKWKSNSKDYLDIHDKLIKNGVFDSKKVQELLKGKGNTPEYTSAETGVQILNELNDYAYTKLQPAFSSADKALDDLIAYNLKITDTSNQIAKQDQSQTTFLILMGLIIGPVVAGVFGVYFSNTIVKPMGAKIAQVVGVAEKVSIGDLTTQVEPTEAKDEIGRLMMSFRVMTENLNTLIRQVQQSGIQITTASTNISASGKELESTMVQQVASTNQVAATAREIAANSKHLVKTIDEVEDTSKITGIAAGDSQKDLLQMEATMRKLVGATSSIATKLGVISDKANSINTIVTTITKVADQTNLLSLNAAIEAEKAGEYGTGFAVVAREIRRLADQTAVATLDIENMVREMQGAVSTGVMEMDKFTKEVEQGVSQVEKISNKLESIIEQVQNLTPRFEEVGNSMESQSQGASQISEAMVQLSESSSQTAQSLREINQSISELNQAAQGLRQEVSRFKVLRNT